MHQMRSKELFYQQGDRSMVTKRLKYVHASLALHRAFNNHEASRGRLAQLSQQSDILNRQLFAIDNDIDCVLSNSYVVIDNELIYKPIFDDETEVLYLLKGNK